MLRRIGLLAGVLALALALVGVLGADGVSAHERRAVAGGKYQLVVGFLDEPSYEGQPNGLDLTVTDLSQKDAAGNGKPVDGLEKTLKAEVIVGGNAKVMPLTLEPRFGLPGKYAGYFEPTRAGSYTFHIFGQIGGQSVDETFESGPNTFGDVEPISAVQFPDKVGSVADLQAQVAAAQSGANTARAIAIAGVVVGALGLAVAAVALLRRPAAAPAPRPATTRVGGED
ncbi:MAG TPA: hypothetical protein VFL91_24115 [Thermomicrobiales bacterium]|nr:hypothetical protein [Thermomicrobiales bacterium]